MHKHSSILKMLPSQRAAHRGGFTLVELMVAGLVAAMLFGTISTSLGSLANAKSVVRLRANAFARADAALESIRRDVISVLRRDDLFHTQLLLVDNFERTAAGEMARDELLLFNLRLRDIRQTDYAGEGAEYETQYRIEDDDDGSVLWQRRDPVPDTNPYGGGVLTPLVFGVISLNLEAYDGEDWIEYWDSDEDGIPHAIRITVTATGEDELSNILESPLATLRTIVPLDRVIPPADLFEPEEEEEEEDDEISDMRDQIDAVQGEQEGNGTDSSSGDGSNSAGGNSGLSPTGGGSGGGGGSSGGGSSGGGGSGGSGGGDQGGDPNGDSPNNGSKGEKEPAGPNPDSIGERD